MQCVILIDLYIIMWLHNYCTLLYSISLILCIRLLWFTAAAFFCWLVTKSCLTLLWPLELKPTRLCHGLSQTGILEWVAISLGHLPNPGIESTSPALWGAFFTTESPGKHLWFITCYRFVPLNTINFITLLPFHFYMWIVRVLFLFRAKALNGQSPIL